MTGTSSFLIAGPALPTGMVPYGITTVGLPLLTRTIAADRPSAPTEVPGRYAAASVTTAGSLRILDTATGTLRTCTAGSGDTAMTCAMTCGEWGPT